MIEVGLKDLVCLFVGVVVTLLQSLYLPVTEISAGKISNMADDEKPYGCYLENITKEEIKDTQCMYGLFSLLMMLRSLKIKRSVSYVHKDVVYI